MSLFGSASHTPHSSSVEGPFITPAQSSHVELSPLHTPHWSSTAVEPHSLSQPPITEVPPQTPAQSSILLPLQTPAQSSTADPLSTPAQS